MYKRFLWMAFLLILPAFASMACDCGGDIGRRCKTDYDCTGDNCAKGKRCICVDGVCQETTRCRASADCGEGFVCKDGKCVKRSRCRSNEDCPDGKVCNVDLGVCEDPPKGACTDNSECKNGKICCDLGDGQGNRCNFAKCLVHEDCRQGSKNTCIKPITCTGGATASCIRGVCKCEEPCGGADCGSGKCCDTQANQCVENPKPCADLKCPPGTDPPDPAKYTVDPKSCAIQGPKCECIKRKPLPLGEAGLYSEIGYANGKVVVSGYNKTYGDLLVGFQQGSNQVKWEFVDGIPKNGKVEGATDGPRGGIKDPGDDVGLHTSLAVAKDGSLHVSYFDLTHGTLKYAYRSAAAQDWKVYVLDDKGKKVGRFTSITLIKGNPAIAYFVVDDGHGKSALRFAQATVAAPTSKADWKFSVIASASKPACKGTCDPTKKQVCVKIGSSFTCKVPTADPDKCKPKACTKDKEICVSGKCLPIEPDDPNPPLPKGVGLFPSIASLGSGVAVISFYDSNKGDLKLAYQKAPNSSSFTVKTLKSKGDVGQFTSIAVDSRDYIHIAYIFVDDVDLYYLRLNNKFAIDKTELVDDGYTNNANGGEDHLIADASIAVDAQGHVRIVYQDSSVQSLKMAIRQSDKHWQRKKLVGADPSTPGAFGFFADQIIVNGTSYISNYKIDLRNKASSIDLRTWKP